MTRKTKESFPQITVLQGIVRRGEVLKNTHRNLSTFKDEEQKQQPYE